MSAETMTVPAKITAPTKAYKLRSSARKDSRKTPMVQPAPTAQGRPVQSLVTSDPRVESSPPSSPEPVPVSRPPHSTLSIDGVYSVILERSCNMDGDDMMDLTVPLQVGISYQRDWPLLLSFDHRDPAVVEEGYLCQGNVAAVFAIRHLARAAASLEDDIRRALGLRDQSSFTLTMPELNNRVVSPMTVIKSLVKQLVVDKYETTATYDDEPSRASLLGLGLYRLRVDHNPADNVQHSNYMARVLIQPLPFGEKRQPRTVHFPVRPTVQANSIVQMVQNLVGRGAEGSVLKLFYNGLEVPYKMGWALAESMFKVEERRMCVDFEAKWSE